MSISMTEIPNKDHTMNDKRRWLSTKPIPSKEKLILALDVPSVEEAKSQLSALYKLLDQVAAAGTIHGNAASRRKSRLAAKLNAKMASAQA